MMHTCERCGEELKVIVVRVPVIVPHFHSPMDEVPSMVETNQFVEREEVCDCPRCHGAY